MRKALKRQQRLDCPAVPNVPLNLNCRNETIPILRALQHIYSTPELRDPILRAIAQDVDRKSREPVQFGRLVLVYEDGAGFITHYHLLGRDERERDVVVEQTRVVQRHHGGKLRRGAFDRGCHSSKIQEELAKILEHPCVPRPGRQQAAGQEKTASVEFRKARQSHPGIESATGAFQSGNGLKRCRDRTEKGFERYIGPGVLGRNLHALGKLLIAREAPHSQAAYSRRKQVA
jgi:IS5 family transposase